MRNLFRWYRTQRVALLMLLAAALMLLAGGAALLWLPATR